MAKQNATRYTLYAKYYLQPAFLICALVLAIAGGAMSFAIESLGVSLKKIPFPLKKSLDLLDEDGLGPYRVLSKGKIANPDIIESLGTKDYIQWLLEDTEAPPDSAVYKCLLFITYYELPDNVPHVPEECYIGGGYQKIGSDSAVFDCQSTIDNHRFSVPGKYLVFGSTNASNWWSDTKFPVLYLFRVNGIYAGSREDARVALNKNIFGKHSYFCKVEWKFFNTRLGAPISPAKQDAIIASQKLLGVILPVLETKHWPDMENRQTGK